MVSTLLGGEGQDEGMATSRGSPPEGDHHGQDVHLQGFGVSRETSRMMVHLHIQGIRVSSPPGGEDVYITVPVHSIWQGG